MRKLYSILLCCIIIMQMSIIAVFASSPVVIVDNAEGKAGENVEVTVDLINCDGFINLGLEFGYDTDVLILEKVTNGVSGALMTKAQTITTNPYNITWNSSENVEHNGTLVTLQFKIAEDAAVGTYPITVDYYKGRNGNNKDGLTVNYDENIESLGLSYVSGSVTVGEVVSSEPQGAYVKVDAVNGKAGETVEVTVDLINCDGFINLGLEFGYDTDVLILEKVTNGVSGALMTTAQMITANPYNITWNSSENVEHNGTLVTLQFKIAEDAAIGTYPITVDYYKGRNGNNKDGLTVNYDENIESLGLSYVPGNLIVKPQKHILSVEKNETNSTIKLRIKANSPDDIGGVFVIALYEGTAMTKVDVVKAQDDLEFPIANLNEKVKVMWWNSLDETIPFCSCVELATNSN